jgi:hypothetical protein
MTGSGQLGRACPPAEGRLRFVDPDGIARARERDRGGETVGPRAYYDCVERPGVQRLIGYSCTQLKPRDRRKNLLKSCFVIAIRTALPSSLPSKTSLDDRRGRW